nr:serglycin-like [Penaeus vannamei]
MARYIGGRSCNEHVTYCSFDGYGQFAYTVFIEPVDKYSRFPISDPSMLLFDSDSGRGSGSSGSGGGNGGCSGSGCGSGSGSSCGRACGNNSGCSSGGAVRRQVFPRDAVTAAQVRPGRWANAVTGSGSGM